MNRNLLILTLATVLIYSASLYAQKKPKTGEEHLKPNEIFVFIGGTSYVDHAGDYFSLGIDYGRLITEHFGMGIWGEAIYADHTEYTGGMLLYLYHHHSFLRAGGGFEILQEAKDRSHPHETESITAFLLRVGVGHVIHFGDFLIAPTLDVDFVRTTTALVYGVNLGYSF